VYLALHWFGQKATGVRASLHRLPDGGVEDEARVVVDFPNGDATVTLTWNGSVRRNAMRLEGERGEIIVADDTLHVNGTRRESTTFPSALSAGSAHADWFAAMLPDVLAGFRDPVVSRPVLEEAAETLSIIRQAYSSDVPLAAPRG
jgi:predicted dehydrogenase